MAQSAVSKISSRGQVVIPKAIREELGLKRGHEILMKVEGGKVIAEPIKSYTESLRGLGKEVWNKHGNGLRRKWKV